MAPIQPAASIALRGSTSRGLTIVGHSAWAATGGLPRDLPGGEGGDQVGAQPVEGEGAPLAGLEHGHQVLDTGVATIHRVDRSQSADARARHAGEKQGDREAVDRADGAPGQLPLGEAPPLQRRQRLGHCCSTRIGPPSGHGVPLHVGREQARGLSCCRISSEIRLRVPPTVATHAPRAAQWGPAGLTRAGGV
jgi:hypothetical protein